MYSLSKNKNTYKIMRIKRRKPKGWIISSKSYMALIKIANNLTNDIPKVHLKRIDLTNTSSSIESIIKEEIDIDDCSLSINEVLNESTENNQQDVKPNISKTNLCSTSFENLLLNNKTADNTDKTEDIYKDSKEYNNDPDYEVSNDSENSDDEPNTSIVSQSFNENEKSNITNSSLGTSQYSYEGKASCDDTNLIVPKSIGAGKKYFCMYCKKLQVMHFSRHLEHVHKNEAEVKKFMSLPKGNSKRKAIIDTIRKESNFIYNTSSQYNTGELIVSRRSSWKAKPALHFTICRKCKGFYSKRFLRHHSQRCYKSNSIDRNVRALARKIQARIHTKACDRVRKEIFPGLKDDDVSKVIRYDELVILHANELSQKFRNHRQNGTIREELRLLGRYLISIKKLNSNITDFASIYQPRHYDSCILAIKNMAQFDPDTNKFKKQSIATRLRVLLKKLGNLLATEYIKRDDNEGSRNVDNFLKRLKEEYETTMNKVAEETVTQNKRDGKIELPVVTSML